MDSKAGDSAYVVGPFPTARVREEKKREAGKEDRKREKWSWVNKDKGVGQKMECWASGEAEELRCSGPEQSQAFASPGGCLRKLTFSTSWGLWASEGPVLKQ